MSSGSAGCPTPSARPLRSIARTASRPGSPHAATSIRSLIPPGARLLVAFGALPAGVGEIIVFAQGERLIAHRVVAWRRSGPIAKGDAEAFCDAPLEREHILGVVRALGATPTRRPAALAAPVAPHGLSPTSPGGSAAAQHWRAARAPSTGPSAARRASCADAAGMGRRPDVPCSNGLGGANTRCERTRQ